MIFRQLAKWLGIVKKMDRNGWVKFFNRRKGYGFIVSEEVGKDVFVHASDLQEEIQKGDRVAFELTHTEKGFEAKNVRLAKA